MNESSLELEFAKHSVALTRVENELAIERHARVLALKNLKDEFKVEIAKEVEERVQQMIPLLKQELLVQLRQEVASQQIPEILPSLTRDLNPLPGLRMIPEEVEVSQDEFPQGKYNYLSSRLRL